MKYAKQWLSLDEIKKILNLQDLPEKYEIWILLLYVPALRVSEAINVRVRDLNFNDVCVDVWGGKGRDSTKMQKAPCDIGILKRISRYCGHSNLDPMITLCTARKHHRPAERTSTYRLTSFAGWQGLIRR